MEWSWSALRSQYAVEWMPLGDEVVHLECSWFKHSVSVVKRLQKCVCFIDWVQARTLKGLNSWIWKGFGFNKVSV